ncbi:MAG TPA: hypothetical protein VMH41_12285 [Mycobacteriales bacterium]|nr:hypothetical protein [Mycobacteriales bacterium]
MFAVEDDLEPNDLHRKDDAGNGQDGKDDPLRKRGRSSSLKVRKDQGKAHEGKTQEAAHTNPPPSPPEDESDMVRRGVDEILPAQIGHRSIVPHHQSPEGRIKCTGTARFVLIERSTTRVVARIS